MGIWETIAALGVPSAIIGGIIALFFKRLEKKIDDDRKEQERKEKARREYEVFQVKTMTAVMALSKANAIALKNGKCNGETSAALAYLDEVKHEQRDFLSKQGIDHLF